MGSGTTHPEPVPIGLGIYVRGRFEAVNSKLRMTPVGRKAQFDASWSSRCSDIAIRRLIFLAALVPNLHREASFKVRRTADRGAGQRRLSATADIHPRNLTVRSQSRGDIRQSGA